MLDIQSLVKYLLEGLAVAVAAYYIPRKTSDLKEIAVIALTAAATFAILDNFAPLVSAGARHGSGFGIGYTMATGGAEGDTASVGSDTSDTSDKSDKSDTSSEPEPHAPTTTEGFATLD
jgi:hypothetical protein